MIAPAMKLQRIKALVWLAALAVTALLAWEVVRFLQNQERLRAAVSREERLAVLEAGVEEPEPPRDERVQTTRLNQVFHRMDWTGRPAPVEAPPPTGKEDEPPPAPLVPVAQLLKVLLIHVDERDPSGSLAVVRYVDPELQRLASDPDDEWLREDERLPGSWSHVRVERIGVDGVRFAFDDGRESEVVQAVPYPSERGAIVVVPEGGALAPRSASQIPTSVESFVYRPKETRQIGRNRFQIGTETVRQVDQDYSRILSQDLQYRRAIDPATGRVEGLQITRVAPGSLPEKHGLSEGEIVKSINGHPVTSVSDAVAYVKQNAATTDTWVVVFEKFGREYTRTYQSPPPE